MAIGERTMVTKMRFKAGMTARAHTHPHEQAGYVISGRYRQTLAGANHELAAGDSYAILAASSTRWTSWRTVR